MTITLDSASYRLTAAKITKINERAAKKGFTGRVGFTATKRTETTTDQLGFEHTETVYDVEMTGEAPSYNGWSFLARIDRVGETFTIATAPGVDHVDREGIEVGKCDHCQQDRVRNNTYLVQNVETGERRQVGSTCIKDFLGWEGRISWYDANDFASDFEGGWGSGYEEEYSLEYVVAVSYAVQKAFGWVPSSDWTATPTAEHVRTIVGRVRLTPKQREMYAPVLAYVEESKDRAATVVAWVASEEFGGKSTYVDNLKALAAAGTATWKQIGLAASAPRAYARFLETAAEREAKRAQWAAEKAARTASVYIGEAKDKVEVTATITSIRYISGDYGTTTLYTMLTEEGNIVKWFSTAGALGDEEGRKVTIKGTVKGHDDYQGTKSTVLTRCKEVTA